VKLVLAGLVVAAVMLASTEAAMPSPANAPRIVTVTISPTLTITFSKSTFSRGKVVFKIKNQAKQLHQFMINGARTKNIPPHRSASLTVVFKRPSIYQATLPDCGYVSSCVGGNPDNSPIGLVKVT
jgi:hypothetical protein